MRHVPAWVLPCATAALLAACVGPTQRVPGAMRLETADELPAPDPSPGTGPVTTVTRHADPVEIRRPGALDAFPMRFWDKMQRVAAGTEIRTRAGGRAELTWPGDATTVVLSDGGSLVLGDPALGEPLVRLLEVTHARLSLTPEDRIGLPGGAELRGDDEVAAGPFVLRRTAVELVRLTNQSGRTGLLRFRDVALELGPGEAVDLPLVASSAPARSEREPLALERGGLRLAVSGSVESLAGERTAQVRASEDALLEALGVRIELEAGDVATLSSMQRRTPSAAEPIDGSRSDPPISALSPN